MPSAAPCSSTTTAIWVWSRCSSRSEWEDAGRLRQHQGRGRHVLHDRVGIAEEVPQVHDANDVVQCAGAPDRRPRVPAGDQDHQGVGAPGVGVEGHHVWAGPVDLAQRPVCDLEGAVDDAALLGRERDLLGHHLPELLRAHLLRLACGSPPRRRTTTSVERDSSHTIGRVAVDAADSGRATSSPHDSARCMAMRLGASSPTTRVA